MSVVST